MLKKPGKILLPLAALLVAAAVLGQRRRSVRPRGLRRIFVEGEEAVLARIREGRFSRTLALVAGLSGLPTGADVLLEHYRGSYGQKVMWSPVILSGAMAVAGPWGALSHRAAKTVLRWTSAVSLVDGLVGFGFHVRGIARKPGGWRAPVANIVMGPPITAPLLFGVAAYLGLIASYLRPEEAPAVDPRTWGERTRDYLLRRPPPAWRVELREGRFQKHLAVATMVSTFCSGFEALYSHYKTNFRYKVQWTPVIMTPLLMGAAGASIKSARVARTWLPGLSILAMLNGAVGFFFHVRGVLRRPGGTRQLFYNLIYGPPVFAPLLFSACGFYGLLASLMRRETE